MLRWDHAVELALGGLTTYLARGCMVKALTMNDRLFWLATACCFMSATIGVWFAREWARWAFGLLAAFATVGLGVQAILTLTAATDQENPLTYGVVALLWGVVAHHTLRPSTKRQFGFAREAIDRARASSA